MEPPACHPRDEILFFLLNVSLGPLLDIRDTVMLGNIFNQV